MSEKTNTNADFPDNPPPRQGARAVPAPLRFGSVVVLLQCVVAYGYAIWLVVANLSGTSDDSLTSESAAAEYVGIGTAVFIILIFGFVAWCAVRLIRGTTSGTGAIVLLEAILVGVAFYMFSGGAWALGLATLLSALLAIIGVFHPASGEHLRRVYADKTGTGTGGR
ncbi:hypothetical protein [Corynebacterium timonense]|uniref:hypothetical protein n=1 Tax=Corynebacterium timonense TaxID=441500 RepID=UPI001E5E916D|nr:hypothetical protein [Corynebacterium timonense]